MEGARKMLCALIMAGGKGTRFWPISTDEKPKQFLRLTGTDTMLQLTVNRISRIIPKKNIFICTGEKYIQLIKDQIPDLPIDNIIIEPIGRNTGPCVLLSTLYIERKYGNCEIIVLPSDHIIEKKDEFSDIVNFSKKIIATNSAAIVTIGIKPDRPETGYGYIETKTEAKSLCNKSYYKVDKFIEKPDLIRAKQYFESNNFYWNAGIFVFNNIKMIEQYKKYSSDLYCLISSVFEEDYIYENLKNIYSKCESISIDYAIMEKTKDIYVVPASIGWDDVGSWKALERYMESDQFNNINRGKSILKDSSNNLIFSSNKTIILNNVNDLYIIESDNVIIVGKKNNLDNIYKFREVYLSDAKK